MKKIKEKIIKIFKKVQEKRKLLKELKNSENNIVRFSEDIAKYECELNELNESEQNNRIYLLGWIEHYKRMLNIEQRNINAIKNRLNELK